MVHDDVAERIPPSVICFRHRVAVGFEAVVGFGEFLFRSVGLMPLNVVDKGRDSETRMQGGNKPSQPFGKGMSGRRELLPVSSPLRTVRASFPAYGSSF